MLVSVIIPTHNRARILQECLRALLKQNFPPQDYEIIVVDDGSRDNTREVVKKIEGNPNPTKNPRKSSSKKPAIYYIYQKNQGQGIARNKGIQEAKGQIIVLINDDIIVTPDFLNEHVRIHLYKPDENEAVLGLTAWHPKLKLNRFMLWMTNGSSVLGRFGGHQFAYEKLKGKDEADYNFFYTSNISLKHSLLDKYPFNPTFSGYGWEDIELGYRLHKKENLRIYYNSHAIGYHDHWMDQNSLFERMRNIGRSAWIFHRRYPELKKVPGFLKRLIFLLISNSPTIFLLKYLNKNLYYYALSKKYFLEGLSEGSPSNFKTFFL